MTKFFHVRENNNLPQDRGGSGITSFTISIPEDDGNVPISRRFFNCTPREKRLGRWLTIFIGISLILLIAFVSYIIHGRASNKDLGNVCVSSTCVASAAMILQNMDSSADPCKDFYQFACGRWPIYHPIPDSSQSVDWFTDRRKNVQREIRDALNRPSEAFEPRAVKQARQFYLSCMDTDAMESQGISKLRRLLDKLGLPLRPKLLQTGPASSAKENLDWAKVASTGKRLAGFDLFVGVSVYPDPVNNSRNIMGLGLPSWTSPLPGGLNAKHQITIKGANKGQEIYERKRRSTNVWGKKDVERRQKYMSDVMKMLFISGLSADSAATITQQEEDTLLDAAKIIFDFESQLYALSNMTSDDIRVNPMTVDELQRATDLSAGNYPKNRLVWRTYFTRLLNGTNVSVRDAEPMYTQDVFLMKLVELLSTTPVTTIEAAMWWQVIDALVPFTTHKIREAQRSYIESLMDTQVAVSRSMSCAGATNALMGMAVSYLFASPSYIQQTTAKVGEMIADIRSSFFELVRAVDWMDNTTRDATIYKATAMKVNIAFPAWILERNSLDSYYDGLKIEEGQYLDNCLALLDLFVTNMLGSLPNPNIATTWASDPTDVNAYHSFQDNTITIPAAILQFPFYGLGLEVLDYGAIGSILGHELTHGFDNFGRYYDENGNYRSWWSNATTLEYEKRMNCFILQYNKMRIPEIHMNVDGVLTLAENIADNVGIRQTIKAYEKLRERRLASGTPVMESLPGLEHLKPEQLMFLSYANLWCENSSPQAMEWSLMDEHAPNRARVWGSLSNSRSFSEAWHCPRDAPMNPREKCVLW